MVLTRLAAVVFSFGALLACSEEGDEEQDPRPIMNACNFPKPCGAVTLDDPQGVHIPLEANACMHDVLARSEPAHLWGRRVAHVGDWGGDLYWDLYTAGGGTGVLTYASLNDPPHDCEEDCGSASWSYSALDCTIKGVEAFQCYGCGSQDCTGQGFVPTDLVCGHPGLWCSESFEIEPGCP